MASLRFASRITLPEPYAVLRRQTPPPPRRNISSTATSSSTVPPPLPYEASILSYRARVLLYLTTTAVTGSALYLYATDTRASLLHQYLIPPLLRTFVPDAETAHYLGTYSLRTLYDLNLHPRDRTRDSGLSVNVFGRTLSNPVGISAGLDKDAQVPDPLFALGAAVVEVGGITPQPQAGNPKPRVFRVPSLDGMVNRYGLNSSGAEAVARTLRSRLRNFARAAGLTEDDILYSSRDDSTLPPPGSLHPNRLLCVQVAKAKTTDENDVEAVARDYADCVRHLAPYADVLVVNVSSPNTPGLRDLQAAGPLSRILSTVVEESRSAASSWGRKDDPPRVMVKVSPDEDSDAQVEGVVEAVWSSGVDGVIVGNTTKRRDVVPLGVPLSDKDLVALQETGGYSGPAMFDRTLALVRKYRKALDEFSFNNIPNGSQFEETAAEAGSASLVPTPSFPSGKGSEDQKVIFATGGITNGKQALQVLNTGASVIMVYTAMTYGGAGTVTRIKGEIKEELSQG